MRYSLDGQQCRNLDVSSRKEWLLTNGLGGYAMGTPSGITTRRYHAHLVAATTPPTGRTALLVTIDAHVQTGPNPVGISANQYPGVIHPEGYLYLMSFAVDKVARWRYRAVGCDLEKSLQMHPGENAVTIRYTNKGELPFTLLLRPLCTHRDHHGESRENPNYPQMLRLDPDETILENDGIALHLSHPSASRVPVQGWYYRVEHAREIERGLEPRDDLYCPCELRYDLSPGESIAIVASAGARVVTPLEPQGAPEPEYRIAEMLRDAADKFVVSAARDTVIAGYPWFTDWGRDTMISLPGLLLHTGRFEQAKRILSAFAAQRSYGLIPNRFVEIGETPDYNTVDATLWFANAAYRTLDLSWEHSFAAEMLEALEDICDWHLKGTLFGIGVDPSDGLLRQGEPGVQLTWMDAKVGDWVVTPRHGKPVEINALWINMLQVLAWLTAKCRELGQPTRHAPEEYAALASKATASFEAKFWHEVRGHYLDTVDPVDASLRPNQVLAMALPWSPMDKDRGRRALMVVGRELLTPYGLRTLGPSEPGYRGRFRGSLSELDSAYHQGTVWPWLTGSYVTALVRYTGDVLEAKRILRGCREMLHEYGLGGIAEVYDGEGPHLPAGCPWQAWSVAEYLRAWVEDCKGE